MHNKFKTTNFNMNNLRNSFSHYRNNSIYLMKIKNSSFDEKSNKIFVNALMCYEKMKHTEIVLVMSLPVAEHLMERLNSQLKFLKGGIN